MLVLLLHISDIHFKHPECANPEQDPDLIYREAMLDDVDKQVGRLGKMDAILVGGDIAFKGSAAEYECAQAWLAKLAEVARCPVSRKC